jgi:hypothetical protein
LGKKIVTAFIYGLICFMVGFYDGFQVKGYVDKQDRDEHFSRCPESKNTVQSFVGYDRIGWVHCFEHKETNKGRDYIKRSVIGEPA